VIWRQDAGNVLNLKKDLTAYFLINL